MGELTAQQKLVAAELAREGFYFFSRYTFLRKKNFPWMKTKHHAQLCDALSIAGGSLASSIAIASSGSTTSHSSASPAVSHTGMRSWIWADTPLLSPVITVKVPRLSGASRGLASFHRPAASSGSVAWMNKGSFFPSSALTDYS